MLPYDERAIKSIIQRFMEFDKSIKISANAEDDVHSLIAYLRYESTILFHLGEVEYTFYPNCKMAVLNPCYLYSKREYESTVLQLTATVQRIRDQICTSASALEREKRIHDALCSNVSYSDEGEESHSIVGPLLRHRGVCDGISKAAKVLLQECGIKSYVIHGTAVTTTSKAEPHAWNVVCINDKWYHLDITFDNTLSSNNIRYDYFNISSNEIANDHTEDDSSFGRLVRCTDDRDYYIINNVYFDSLTEIKKYVSRCVLRGERHIQIRVARDIHEKDVSKAFHQGVSCLSQSVFYEQSVNHARNVYVWSIK